MDSKSKVLNIGVVVALLVVVGVGFWLWSQRKAPTPEMSIKELSPAEAEETLGGQIIGKTQNPIKGQLPETNPFQSEANPLKDIYKNPF